MLPIIIINRVSCFLAANLAHLLHGHQNAHTTLKCLAARCIASNRISFKGMIPKQLEAFIQMHSVHKVLS